MRQTCLRIWVVIGGLMVVSGCAGSINGMISDLESQSTALELADIPFHSQITDQCGPAALATILNQSNVDVTPAELRSRTYIPEREGALQLELQAATRHYNRIPYNVDPEVKGLLSQLQAGRPVLILQNLGAKLLPIWHYAVVVGYLPEDKQFVLRSGDTERHLMPSRRFIRAWQRADYWGFVALQPGELPANPDADRYLRSVASSESLGNTSAAVAAYRAATDYWPQNELAWLGFGNAAYAEGDLDTARYAYQSSLTIDPTDAIALNNLAQVHADLGCRSDALTAIHEAMARVDADDQIYGYLDQTLEEIEQNQSATLCR